MNTYRLLILGIGLAVVGGIVALFMTKGSPSAAPKPITTTANSPAQVLRPLASQHDLTTCRNTLQQMNILLSNDPSLRSTWTPRQRDDVVAALGLSKSEQGELDSSEYTLLDGQYLESCLLLHDAARTLTAGDSENLGSLAGPGAPNNLWRALDHAIRMARLRHKALARARAAFAWSVRQVRLQPHTSFLTPPEFALRRGWGSDLERALVFLSLLRQMGPSGTFTGCLIFNKDADGKEALWACGVAIRSDDRLFLFDPRIGLPLPGPDGTGVATLREAARDPRVLAQLTVDKRYPYDMTAERVTLASVRFFCPLSGLPPRAAALERHLHQVSLMVNLAVNPLLEKSDLTIAVRAALGDKAEVSPWMLGDGVSGASVLRQFLPESEGGTDRPTRWQARGVVGQLDQMNLYKLEMLPLGGLPPPFNDPIRFPTTVGLGKRVQGRFFQYYVEPFVEPGQPRDLMLRGDFAGASPKLREDILLFDQRMERKRDDPDLRAKVDKWVAEQAIPAYARLVRLENAGANADPQEIAEAQRQVNQVMANEDAHVLLDAGIAENLLPELAYLQALCKHEEAEQMQARLDARFQRGLNPNKEDLEEIQTAWVAARDLWRDYLSRSRASRTVARVDCYRSYARAILMSHDVSAFSATSRLLLAVTEGRLWQFASACLFDSLSLHKQVRAELAKALDDLDALTDDNLAAYVGYERVAILYLMRQFGKE